MSFFISKDDWEEYLERRQSSGRDSYPLNLERFSTDWVTHVRFGRAVRLVEWNESPVGAFLLHHTSRAEHMLLVISESYTHEHEAREWDSPLVRFQEDEP